LSHAYRQDLNWLISDFAARVGDVAHAAVVSADGVPLALSEQIPGVFAEHLAAITSGLASLMLGAARIFEAGTPTQALVEMEFGLMLIKSIGDGSSLCVLASPDCDTDLVSYRCRCSSRPPARCCPRPCAAAAGAGTSPRAD
jgi:uncharacterized protein